jgi:glycosyltransferase involved in cell wall biosynthesis
VSAPRRVVIPTVYRADCPTVRSRLLPLCRELVPRGYSFEFLVLDQAVPQDEPGIRYSGYRDYFEMVRRVAALKRRDVDLIMACKAYSVTGLLSFAVARLRGIGYLLDVDDRTFPSEINKWWRLPLYVQEWLSERLLMLLRPPTSVASRALAEHFGKHAAYVPNSANLENFAPGSWDSGFIGKRHGLEGQVVVWPAVFFQETDRRYVLEIFSCLAQQGSRVTLLVLGDGDFLPEIKARAAGLGLDRVVFAGSVPYADMPHYYASASAGLLPLRDNHYDACKGPIKLYEYMAMELPVIATDIGEPREMVNRADCGILIPFAKPREAAAAIEELLGSPERLRRCGSNGRRFLVEQHDFAHHAARLAELLEPALNRKR